MNKLLPGIRKNILLKNYTTFKIGGPAQYFFIAKTKKDIVLSIKLAKKLKLPFFILGGGSNLLVSDKGFKGLVIKIQNTKYKIQNTKIHAEAGTPLAQLVNASVRSGLTGLEWAIGIPGTIGGAIYGNAGWPSNKKNISSVVESVKVLQVSSSKSQVASYRNEDCQFGYRESVFKKNKNLVILSTVLKFKKRNKEHIKREIFEILNKRKNKIPIGFSAGSVFKNPSDFPAGELIEKCGLKGKMIGNAEISEKHANFIINLGDAKAKDVKKLINLAKKSVKNKFGIILKEEIQYLPPKF